MSTQNFTTKSQEAISAALQSAAAKGNPSVEPAHLLVALLEQEDGIAGPLLRSAGAVSYTHLTLPTILLV